MSVFEGLVNTLVRGISRLLFKFDPSPLQTMPRKGPVLMIVNHVSNFEGPMMYVYLRPRNTYALAKRQLWDHLITRKLMEVWKAIPVDRGVLDRQAMNQCFAVLKQGDYLCIAPEGTRSRDGTLQRGKAGIAYIAARKQVPIIPVATTGFEQFPRNIRRLRRTPVTFTVGSPFEILPPQGRVTPQVRQVIADEMMMRLAQQMPPEYRGYYADREFSYSYTRGLE